MWSKNVTQVALESRRVAGLDLLVSPGDPGGMHIVLLHGYGASASDLASLSERFELTPRPTFVFPEGPLEIEFAPGFTGRAWFPIDLGAIEEAFRAKRYDLVSKAFPSHIEQVRTQVHHLVQELDIAPGKVVLGGFSQGAILSVECALHAPVSYGALLIFSGSMIHEVSWKRLAPLHLSTHFFQSHGKNDTILPYSLAQSLEKVLVEAGLKGRLHSFEGGHEIPEKILKSAEEFLCRLV